MLLSFLSDIALPNRILSDPTLVRLGLTPMDTQSGPDPTTNASNKDVDIPDASDDEDSDSSHTGSVRTVTPKAGRTGYRSN